MRRLPMFPLSTMLYPHATLPLHVFEPRYQRLTADCLEGSGEFGVVLITRGSEVGGGDERAAVGTVAGIERASALAHGHWMLVVTGRGRFRIAEWLDEDPYPVAMVEDLPGDGAVAAGPSVLETTVVRHALTAVRRARALLSELGDQPALAANLDLDDDAEVMAWQLCAMAPITPFDGQRLLEVDDPSARLTELAGLSAAVADDLALLLAGGTD